MQVPLCSLYWSKDETINDVSTTFTPEKKLMIRFFSPPPSSRSVGSLGQEEEEEKTLVRTNCSMCSINRSIEREKNTHRREDAILAVFFHRLKAS